MSHRRFTHRFRRTTPATRSLAALIAFGLPLLPSAKALAQIAAPVMPAYRTPAIALVQPPSGGTVPQDRPVVVFRFSQGEPDDQLDLRSFSVAVDGKDVTTGFQIAGSDAWGPLLIRSESSPIALGAHEVSAQLCSARGACASVRGTVNVLPPLVGSTSPSSTSSNAAPAATSRKRRILEATLNAARRLLTL